MLFTLTESPYFFSTRILIILYRRNFAIMGSWFFVMNTSAQLGGLKPPLQSLSLQYKSLDGKKNAEYPSNFYEIKPLGKTYKKSQTNNQEHRKKQKKTPTNQKNSWKRMILFWSTLLFALC